MEFKPRSLEHAIFYLSYSKAIFKKMARYIEDFHGEGIFDEAENALVEGLLIGCTKIDGEFERAIEAATQRTDQADHIALALSQVIKKMGLENDSTD